MTLMHLFVVAWKLISECISLILSIFIGIVVIMFRMTINTIAILWDVVTLKLFVRMFVVLPLLPQLAIAAITVGSLSGVIIGFLSVFATSLILKIVRYFDSLLETCDVHFSDYLKTKMNQIEVYCEQYAQQTESIWPLSSFVVKSAVSLPGRFIRFLIVLKNLPLLVWHLTDRSAPSPHEIVKQIEVYENAQSDASPHLYSLSLRTISSDENVESVPASPLSPSPYGKPLRLSYRNFPHTTRTQAIALSEKFTRRSLNQVKRPFGIPDKNSNAPFDYPATLRLRKNHQPYGTKSTNRRFASSTDYPLSTLK